VPLDRSLEHSLDDRHELPDSRIADVRRREVGAESSEHLRGQIPQWVSTEPWQDVNRDLPPAPEIQNVVLNNNVRH
jgi:hypothetical protein